MTDSMLNYALNYAGRGIAVFPLAEGARVPMRGSHGLRDATIAPDRIKQWWTDHPSANIGAATGVISGFWCLDCDEGHKDGASGTEMLTHLIERFGPIPSTVIVGTPNGGSHLWFRWRDDVPELRNSVGRLGPGLDVRGNGGQTILPPSRLKDGREYRWAFVGKRDIADAPDWMIALALPEPRPEPKRRRGTKPGNLDRYIETALSRELAAVANAANGTRNDTLNRAAFNLSGLVKADALPEDYVVAELHEAGKAAGLPYVEIERTIASAFGAAVARELPR